MFKFTPITPPQGAHLLSLQTLRKAELVMVAVEALFQKIDNAHEITDLDQELDWLRLKLNELQKYTGQEIT